MLIVRLYDGDVSERERNLANTLIGECGECAQLYADLGSIAAATATVPTPPRPRDFFLTEADAARLGRPDGTPVRASGRLSWPVLRRSFGGALAAFGLVGVLLTGASNLTASHSASVMSMDNRGPNAAPQAAQPMPATGAVAMPTAAPAQAAATSAASGGSEIAQLPGATPRNGTTANATSPLAPNASPPDMATSAASSAASPATQQGGDKSAATVAPSTAPAADGGQLVAGPTEGYAYNGSGTSGGSTVTPTGKASPGALDARTVAFAGFVLALVLGLALLIGPKVFGRLRGAR